MKNLTAQKTYLYTFKHILNLIRASAVCTFKAFAFTLLFIASHSIAKSNPIIPISRSLAFKRAKSLDNGVSISWYEQIWNKDILKQVPVSDVDFKLLKQLGFKSIRLPVAFSFFQSANIPDGEILTHIDNMVKNCRLYGFKLVICYHSGKLTDSNYLNETPKISDLWLKLAKRYAHKYENTLFFEIYNEPPPIDPQIWKDAAYNIVTAIRRVDKERTLIVGASNYNSIYELSRFIRLADENIIYTFHFYEPFLFTHQGAEWIGNQVATVGVPFPYSAENFPAINPKSVNTNGQKNYNMYAKDGNDQSVNDKLSIVKNWGQKYDVPLLCGEYGVYNKYADLASRCRYIKAVRQTLKKLNIPGILWDYNSNFSVFNGPPSIGNLPDCINDAIKYP
jgi:endoglucanase